MAPKALSEREVLYRDVEFERLSAADADAQLVELGEKPFQSCRPDLSRLDPMLENEWTLPMAAAWFIWRSAIAVRDQWNPAREGWRKWVRLRGRTGLGPPGPRLRLRDFGRATVADVFSQVGLPTDSHAGKATARKSVASNHVQTPYSRLEDALRSGRLRATWGKREDGDFEEIAPEYWRLKFKAIANPKRQSSPEEPRAATLLPTARALISSKSALNPLQAAELPPNKVPTINNDEAEDLPDLSLVEETKSTNQVNVRAYAVPYDEHSDIFVRREDVLKAEKEISQAEYEHPDWSLGQTLGWIAYQKREIFRSLWETDLNPRPIYYGEAYSPEFAIGDPVSALKEKLLSGTLVGYQDGEAILSTKWIGSEVWDRPRVRFTRAGVIKIWKELPPAAPPRMPRASKEKMTEIHEGLNAERGSQPNEQEFRDRLKELGFDSNVKRAREFREKYAAERGISFEPGPRGKRKPRPDPARRHEES